MNMFVGRFAALRIFQTNGYICLIFMVLQVHINRRIMHQLLQKFLIYLNVVHQNLLKTLLETSQFIEEMVP